MTHRGPFQPLPFCDSVMSGQVKTEEVRGESSFHISDPWQSIRKQGQECPAEVFLWDVQVHRSLSSNILCETGKVERGRETVF